MEDKIGDIAKFLGFITLTYFISKFAMGFVMSISSNMAAALHANKTKHRVLRVSDWQNGDLLYCHTCNKIFEDDRIDKTLILK